MLRLGRQQGSLCLDVEIEETDTQIPLTSSPKEAFGLKAKEISRMFKKLFLENQDAEWLR